MRAEGWLRRLRTVTAAVAIAATLTACGSGSDSGGAPPPSSCASSDSCFPVGDMSALYCAVVQLRARIVAGRLDLSDLPGWADPAALPDGAPRIYDFRRPDPAGTSYAERRGQLADALQRAGRAPIDVEHQKQCVRALAADEQRAQQRIRGSEGGDFRS